MSDHTKHKRSASKRRSHRSRGGERYVKLRNGKMIRREIYIRRIIGRIVVFVLLIGIVATVARRLNEEETIGFQGGLDEIMPTVIEVRKPLIPLIEAKSSLSKVLNRHYASLPEGNVKSFSFSGTYDATDAQYEFESYSRHDKQYRQIFRSKNREFSASINDSVYAESFQDKLLKREVEGVERLNPSSLVLETDYYAIINAYNTDGFSSLQLSSDDGIIDGKACFILEQRYSLEVPVMHYIEKETGLELRRVATFDLGDVQHEIVIEYSYGEPIVSEFNEETGPKTYMAQSYKMMVDGELYALAKIDSYRANIGMPNWFFDLKAKAPSDG